MAEENISTETAAAIRKEVKQAMTEWTRETLLSKETLEHFWGTAFDVLQEKAQEHTGKFVVASIGGLLRKLSVFILLGALVYSAGGWTALVNLFKHAFATSSLPH